MRLHQYICLAVLFALCLTQQTSAQMQPTDTTDRHPITLGVYYYPWYKPASFNTTLRGKLTPQQSPAVGRYDSRDPQVIASHIDQSRRGNIRFWAVSWWGPNHDTDITIRNHILKHPRIGEVDFCIHYEATGRFGPFDNPHFDTLTDDFRYLAKTYFQQDNYLRVDGKPVVIIYLTRAYFLTEKSRQAVRDMRKAIEQEFGLQLYLVGDDFYSDKLDPERAVSWDAVTSFDVYGMAFQIHGCTQKGLDVLENIHKKARNTAHDLGVDFIPTVSPGFNDTAVRDGHPPRPRYLTLNGQPQPPGSLFSASLKQTALPYTDPAIGRILMVNSFNEWYEDTQIEPTAPGQTTSTDSSDTQKYTAANSYEAYEDKYLSILAALTKPEK